MARRELGPAALRVARAVAAVLPAGEVVIGCSGGADSTALALGAAWAAPRCDARPLCVVVDHGLQEGSGAVADAVGARLAERGIAVEVVTVQVERRPGESLEDRARVARLEALAARGASVLLGHTLDDQAETVLLGLLRGSGTRSLAGMATVRGPFVRPLLGLRRADTVAACREWGIAVWDDPHNHDDAFARVRARQLLASLSGTLGRDVAPALARTAALARTDADFLDDLAARAGVEVVRGPHLPVDDVAALPEALRLRVLRDWLAAHGVAGTSSAHLCAVDALLGRWRGQGPVAIPGARVARIDSVLRLLPA